MNKIDTTTPEGKAKLTELLVNSVINAEPDKIAMDGLADPRAYKRYEEALVLLGELKRDGFCDFSFDSIYESYDMHCVFVEWKLDPNGFAELEAKRVKNLLSKFEKVCFDAKEPFTWQLSNRIYFDKSEVQ